jgi:hypothetical protein
MRTLVVAIRIRIEVLLAVQIDMAVARMCVRMRNMVHPHRRIMIPKIGRRGRRSSSRGTGLATTKSGRRRRPVPLMVVKARMRVDVSHMFVMSSFRHWHHLRHGTLRRKCSGRGRVRRWYIGSAE